LSVSQNHFHYFLKSDMLLVRAQVQIWNGACPPPVEFPQPLVNCFPSIFDVGGPFYPVTMAEEHQFFMTV
jgi:hypothetical protein